MKRAARFKDQITAALLASVSQNKCEAGVASCGIALPSLSPTEVYTEAGDPGPGLDPSTRVAQGGRRHTMGPASHPLPGLQSPPPQFTLLQLKEILPQINLPQNLPPLSTDFSVKNQDLLRALPSPVPMGHHDSDCGVCSSQAREEAECAAEEEMAAADPGTMFIMLGGELEAEAGLYCLGREMWPLLDAPVHGSALSRVCGLRHPAAHTQHEVIIRHIHGGALLAGAGPQLRVEPGDGDGQRDERVQAARRTAHGGTQGHTGPGLIFRYKTITYFKNPANSTKIVHNLNIIPRLQRSIFL